MWLIYEVLLLIGLLCYVPRALWRKRLPHRGWGMRLGRYPTGVATRLQGRSALWVHAVSVGEILACEPLIRQLATTSSQDPIVLSTITPSGFSVASKHLADVAIPIYFPLDVGWCVRRALEAIRPRILLLVESELWPSVVRLTRARDIPIAVVNGRISPRAFQRYQWVRPWLREMLGRIDGFLMQSQADADRIIQLGAPPERVQVVGSLKWEASLARRPMPQDVQVAAARIGLNGQQAVIVAGSTHRGEEDTLLRVFQTLRASHRDIRLIVAPRHLERLAEVEQLSQQRGLTVIRVSQAVASGAWDVGLVDTLGQLPLYYGLADVAFIGGSLIPHGGQNPLEAASLGRPIVFGPFMHNFAEIVQQLVVHHAARQLATPEELTSALQECLRDRSGALAMGLRAQELAERSRGATQRTLETLRGFLTAPSSTT